MRKSSRKVKSKSKQDEKMVENSIIILYIWKLTEKEIEKYTKKLATQSNEDTEVIDMDVKTSYVDKGNNSISPN